MSSAFFASLDEFFMVRVGSLIDQKLLQGIKTEIESVLEELERMLDEEQHLKETLQSEIEDVLVE